MYSVCVRQHQGWLGRGAVGEIIAPKLAVVGPPPPTLAIRCAVWWQGGSPPNEEKWELWSEERAEGRSSGEPRREQGHQQVWSGPEENRKPRAQGVSRREVADAARKAGRDSSANPPK